MKNVPFVLLFLSLVGCGEAPKMLQACSEMALDQICGVQNPEDLAPIPDTNWAVYSQMRSEVPESLRSESGLGFLSLETREVVPFLKPDFNSWPVEDDTPLGDSNCPGPVDPAGFSGHGLDVRALDDGSIVLAAVNHGEREAIELFSIRNDGNVPSATWRGCVPLERGMHHNDVAIAADGSLYFTYFFKSPHYATAASYWHLISSFWGGDTGWVRHWSPAQGIVELEGTEGTTPNGIQLSKDGRYLFVNEWMTRGVSRIDLSQQRPSAEWVEFPSLLDNSTWSADGQLLVTGQRVSFFDIVSCVTQETITTCDIPYEVYRLDPETLEVETLLEGRGTGSVALQYGHGYFIGSFHADSIQLKEASTQ